MTIQIYKFNCQDERFYSLMGRYFASLDIAKELERQVYNKPNTAWFVMTIENSVVAFASVWDAGKHYFLDNLYCLPEFRGRGFATEIVGEVVEICCNKEIKCVAVNPYALRLFSGFGFEECGHNGKYTKLTKHCSSISQV